MLQISGVLQLINRIGAGPYLFFLSLVLVLELLSWQLTLTVLLVFLDHFSSDDELLAQFMCVVGGQVSE